MQLNEASCTAVHVWQLTAAPHGWVHPSVAGPALDVELHVVAAGDVPRPNVLQLLALRASGAAVEGFKPAGCTAQVLHAPQGGM